jgi:hypothetical protein
MHSDVLIGSVDPDMAVTEQPYAYTGDDPVNGVDPLGLCWPSWACGPEHAIGAAATTTWNGIKSFGEGVVGSQHYCGTNGATYDIGNAFCWVATIGGTAGSAYSGGGSSDEEEEDGAPASTPTGQRGSPMDVPRGTNAPVEINGLSYGGHAIDEMQSEGFTPSMIQDAIDSGQQTVGTSGRAVYYSQTNNISVITENGRVVTVSSGALKIR